jgi:hypothetical protein
MRSSVLATTFAPVGLLGLFFAAASGCSNLQGLSDVPGGDAAATGSDDGSVADGSGGGDGGGSDSGMTHGGDGDGSASAGDGEAGSDASHACTDVLTDPLNCGQCGHDCLGGKCTAGLCQPFEWIDDTAIDTLEVDDSHAFYTAKFTLKKADLSNMPKIQVMTDMGLTGFAAAVDSSYLYYELPLNGVIRLPKSAPPAMSDTLVNYKWVANATFQLPGIAVSGGYIFYAASSYLGGASSVYKAPKAPLGDTLGADGTLIGGCNSTEYVVLADAQVGTVHLLDPMAGTIRVMAIDTGAITTVVTAQNGPESPVADDTYLYWVNTGDGTVMSAPKAGGAMPTTLTAGEDTPSSLTLDGPNLYWTTASEVRMCPVRSCNGNVVTVADNQGTAHSIQTNRTAVYWVANEAIMRLAK